MTKTHEQVETFAICFAAFGWMLVVGVLQYLKFVKVLDTYIEHFMWKAGVPAWGTSTSSFRNKRFVFSSAAHAFILRAFCHLQFVALCSLWF